MSVLRGDFFPSWTNEKNRLAKKQTERNIVGLTGVEAGEKVFPLQHAEVYREREVPPVLSLWPCLQNFQGLLMISVTQDVNQ